MLLAVSLLLTYLIAMWDAQVSSSERPLLGGAFVVCSRSDAQLEQCIVDSLNGAREKLAVGIPELNLPPLNPLHADKALVQEGEEEFNLRLSFTNFTWSGLTNYVTSRAKVDFAQRSLELQMLMKDMVVHGPYVLGGRVLTLRINGNGIGEVRWEANVTHRMTFEEEKRGGETYWKVKNYKWTMELLGYHCNFQNLFRGNKRLGQYANEFLNKNWKPIYTIYGGVIDRGVQDVFQRLILDKFFERVPLRQLFEP